MARVGLLSFSDGRHFVHADIKTFTRDVEGRIAQALEQAGHEVIRAAEPIWTNTLATTEARRVADARPDLTIFNYAVWAFPHFSMLAAAMSPGRCCCSPTSTRSSPAWSACWPLAGDYAGPPESSATPDHAAAWPWHVLMQCWRDAWLRTQYAKPHRHSPPRTAGHHNWPRGRGPALAGLHTGSEVGFVSGFDVRCVFRSRVGSSAGIARGSSGRGPPGGSRS
jgi:hypothetical protein